MVYPDLTYTTPNQFLDVLASKNHVNIRDRFFSFFLDYLVITPFVSLLFLLIFKKEILFLKDKTYLPELWPNIFLFGFLYLVVFSLLQALCIYYFRATPGQSILKIKVEVLNSKDFLLWRCFLRQFSFWGSFVFLGIPLISMLTHSHQMTFYDRLADLQLYSIKTGFSTANFQRESFYWKKISAIMTACFSTFVVLFLFNFYQSLSNKKLSLRSLQNQGYLCFELQGLATENRLEYAIALNLVNQLSDRCLDHESDFVLWGSSSKEQSLAYLAKSLTAVSSDLEKSYLKISCSVSKSELNLSCLLAHFLLSGEQEVLLKHLYSQQFKESFLQSVLKYELAEQSNQPIYLSDLKKYTQIRSVKKYLISELLLNKNNLSVKNKRGLASEMTNENKAQFDETEIYDWLQKL